MKLQCPPKPNKDTNDGRVLGHLIFNLWDWNFKHQYIRTFKTQAYHFQVMKPQSGSSSSLLSPKEEIKDRWILCTLVFNLWDCHFEHKYFRKYMTHSYAVLVKKPQPGISSVLRSPNKDMKDSRVLGTLICNLWDWHFKHMYIRTIITHAYNFQVMKPQSVSSKTPRRTWKTWRFLTPW